MKTTIAFTGHRSITTDINVLKEHLLHEIETQYHNGYTSYMSGMALGFDLLAAECVLEIKEKYADIKLICVMPFCTQYKMYDYNNRLRWASIKEKADECVFVSEKYYKECFFHRNDYMLENCSRVIAYYDNSFRSGTGYTIRRAVANYKSIINLYK